MNVFIALKGSHIWFLYLFLLLLLLFYLFIYFIFFQSWHYFNRKHIVVTTALRASKQVLCNVWSYDFYNMTFSTK